jgi:hypothetical protein
MLKLSVDIDKLKLHNPTANFGDMGRLLMDIWKNMSESEKAVYINSPIQPAMPSDLGLRRSSRLKNKLRKVDFFGCKLKN